jgi:hypothetical protein
VTIKHTPFPERCVWKRDPDGDSYVWVVGCTNEFTIDTDAEDYMHCPRCGAPHIEFVTAPLEPHEGRWPKLAEAHAALREAGVEE